MINKKTKSIGIVLLSILMLFSFMLFTACQPLDPADPPSNPPKVYTNADAKTILNKANILLNQKPSPTTAMVEVGTSAMTEYNEIDSWVLNSVDLTERRQDVTATEAASVSHYTNIFLYFLNEEIISINESYVPMQDENNLASYRVKIEVKNNKMILTLLHCVEARCGGWRYLITFNDDFDVQNVLVEYCTNSDLNSSGDCMVQYFANGISYRVDKTWSYGQANTLPVSINGLLQSIKAEYTKPVKQIEPAIINLEELLYS